jgi:hypothetical protein
VPNWTDSSTGSQPVIIESCESKAIVMWFSPLAYQSCEGLVALLRGCPRPTICEIEQRFPLVAELDPCTFCTCTVEACSVTLTASKAKLAVALIAVLDIQYGLQGLAPRRKLPGGSARSALIG